jgi:hypothetical protein
VAPNDESPYFYRIVVERGVFRIGIDLITIPTTNLCCIRAKMVGGHILMLGENQGVTLYGGGFSKNKIS